MVKRVEFCPKCGNLMIPTKDNGKVVLKCRNPKCGAIKPLKENSFYTISEKLKHSPSEKTIVIEEEATLLPKTRIECPKCGWNEAYWWELQTRSADEAPTHFYRCVKCGHTWREYD